MTAIPKHLQARKLWLALPIAVGAFDGSPVAAALSSSRGLVKFLLNKRLCETLGSAFAHAGHRHTLFRSCAGRCFGTWLHGRGCCRGGRFFALRHLLVPIYRWVGHYHYAVGMRRGLDRGR